MAGMRLDAGAVREALKSRVPEVAEALLGEPNRAASARRDLRFGRKGSLSVAIAGERAGLWRDHERDEGGDLIDLIRREAACDFPAALQWAADFLGIDGAPKPPGLKTFESKKRREIASDRTAPDRANQSISATDDDAIRTQAALAIWRSGAPIKDTLAETYLRQARGIDPRGEPWPAALRFHPACPFKGQRVPALIGLMQCVLTGEPRAIHRTALRADGMGKAFPDGAKAMLGPSSGAAIMLDAFTVPTYGLAVAEGIESGLSAMFHPALWLRPMWVAGSAGAVAAFPVLAGIERITALADGDATGRSKARALCAKYEKAGREFELIEPESDHADANDILRGAA